MYDNFIFILCFLFPIIILIIWELLYYHFCGIPISLCFIFSNISVYYIFSFILSSFSFLSSYRSSGHSSITSFKLSQLVSGSFSVTSLSIKFSFSIKTSPHYSFTQNHIYLIQILFGYIIHFLIHTILNHISRCDLILCE